MSTTRALVILALALSACANPTFRYRPEPPLADSSISADYMLMADRLRIEIDTGGYRLLDAQILRADGSTVRPQTVEQPPAGSGSSVGFGFGMGGANYGRGGAVGVGTGVGMEIPMGTVMSRLARAREAFRDALVNGQVSRAAGHDVPVFVERSSYVECDARSGAGGSFDGGSRRVGRLRKQPD